MNRIPWKKWLQSWWGRLLAGAIIGALLVSFSGLNDPGWFLFGMAAGAITIFALGRLQ